MKISLPALIVLLLACFSLEAEAQFRKGIRGGDAGAKKGDLGSRTAERREAMERALRGIRGQEADAKRKPKEEKRSAGIATREGAHYRSLLQRYDRDRNGSLSEAEAAICQRDRMDAIARRETFLKTYDFDGNGEISDAEAARIPRR